MIIFRVVIFALLLIMALIIEYSASFSFSIAPFILTIIAGFALSAGYMLLHYWGRLVTFQAYLQIVLDLALITGLVYFSGGTASSAYFLYIFPVIGAAFVLSSRAAYITASLSAILFGGLVDGMYLGFIPYAEGGQVADLTFGSVVYMIFIAWSAFFLIAFLTNALAGRLRKTRAALLEARRELSISERLSEAGRISATLAHEIRNPLAAISGSVQVLKTELALNTEQRELMDIVLRESQRVSHNLEQFLDFALPAKQPFSVMNLSDILDETLKILRSGGELNGKVTVKGDFLSAGLHYFGSPGQFKQVFWNLIKNALKAMPNGGELEVDLGKPNDDEIRIRIADTGVGMSKADKAHLFEPFYSRFDGGRGLGLSIVRRIVDDYEGRIEFHSEPERGTEVLITLPIRDHPK